MNECISIYSCAAGLYVCPSMKNFKETILHLRAMKVTSEVLFLHLVVFQTCITLPDGFN